MKKILTFLCFVILTTFLSAQAYKIVDANYDISGCRGVSFGKTNKISLELKCPIDKSTTFKTKDEFDKYLLEYEQQLKNLRAFNTIEITYTENLNNETNINEIILNIILVDSSHLLALPYPKYDSNSGFTLKIKAKDSNFLGTLNPLSTDLYVNFDDTANKWAFGLNFAYDYPFKVSVFNGSWKNRLNLDYVIGNNKPTSSTDIGVAFTYPQDKFSINFGFTQSVSYNNIFSFTEKLDFSTPIVLYKAPNFSTVNYNPYINFYFDFNVNTKKINNNNFTLEFGHSISNEKINWNDRFRKGYGVSLNNSFSYDLEDLFPIPTITLEGKFYNNFKLLNKPFLDRFGIYSRLYIYTVLDVPGRGTKGNINIGGRMRGILNDRMDETPYGVVLNLDLPINIITTNFKHTFFNFTMQFSPFIDIALTNDIYSNNFNLNTKNLSAGMEVLVFPHRFSSYTIRGSVGVDIKKVLKSPNKLKGMWNNKEIYIGLDIHY